MLERWFSQRTRLQQACEKTGVVVHASDSSPGEPATGRSSALASEAV